MIREKDVMTEKYNNAERCRCADTNVEVPGTTLRRHAAVVHVPFGMSGLNFLFV